MLNEEEKFEEELQWLWYNLLYYANDPSYKNKMPIQMFIKEHYSYIERKLKIIKFMKKNGIDYKEFDWYE